jgi:glucose-6-phosphate 1-dehydrogenase
MTVGSDPVAAAARVESRRGQPGDPCVAVIFGGGGDLTRRKLLPALYNLARDGLLSERFAVVAFARDGQTTEQFRERLDREIAGFVGPAFDREVWRGLLQRIEYAPGDFRDEAAYLRLKDLLARVDKEHGTGGNYLHYLATPPTVFAEIVRNLGTAALAREEEGRWRRVIIEKPFGRDLESARLLNRAIRMVLNEEQIYRIDHYLGKETVQNMLVFRFANGIFEPVWNRRYIDHVQITVAESLGVERRASYYEDAGALRDMVPNHMFQLLAFTAMEPPISFSASAVRDEKAKTLRAVQPMTPEEVLTRVARGQYGEGTVDGQRLPAYRSEPKVAAGSSTETFVAMKLFIDNWRWADVPFYLRTGKRLPKRATEVAIQFKRAPFVLFRGTSVGSLSPNQLIINIQPDEGISLRFEAKMPGPVVRMGEVDMDFQYAHYFGADPSTGYETLLYDCMIGDATLFQRDDMVEAGWSAVQPILDVWKALPARGFPNYAAGTWGPREADDLIERDGRKWRRIDHDPGGRHRRDEHPARPLQA